MNRDGCATQQRNQSALPPPFCSRCFSLFLPLVLRHRLPTLTYHHIDPLLHSAIFGGSVALGFLIRQIYSAWTGHSDED
ncbi:hypothetical protein OPV22_018432 [Ensete ventricosum]|uniref:Uncharacterized protein n=1 Tax=Ensete ventricosum TaxID=4639 RepID=A0AAV8R0B6_ENSVE|nr:hypothetical protein OPV22_018432 [Ensete ventricosum]